MSDESAAVLKLQIITLRGRLKGRFGWVLYTPEILVQSRRTFPSKLAAEQDASEFSQAPFKALH